MNSRADDVLIMQDDLGSPPRRSHGGRASQVSAAEKAGTPSQTVQVDVAVVLGERASIVELEESNNRFFGGRPALQ